MGRESEGWLSPYERHRSVSVQCITDGLQTRTHMHMYIFLFVFFVLSFLPFIPLSPFCLVSVRLLLQSGSLSANRWCSAAPAAEDWECHPETPLWARHYGPGKKRSPLTPLPRPPTSTSLLRPCSHHHHFLHGVIRSAVPTCVALCRLCLLFPLTFLLRIFTLYLTMFVRGRQMCCYCDISVLCWPSQ